jgi:glycosyltransferase involved in cell wall biosynthesis
MSKAHREPLERSRAPAVKYVSFHEASGYGCAARSYLLGLAQSSYPLTWTPMITKGFFRPRYRPVAGPGVGDAELDRFCNRAVAYAQVLIHLVPEYIPLWKIKEAGKRLVGYCVWETDKLPAHWPRLLNQLDQVLVPCRWNKEVFERSGVLRPIEVIPHLFTPYSSDDGRRSIDPDPAPGHFVFYTIGDWTVRKSIGDTVRCYLNTFTAADPVTFIIKTSSRDSSHRPLGFRGRRTRSSLKEIVRSYKNPARIVLIDKPVNAHRMAALHRRGDCYISLCRAEGWGLGAFDAAASGKPVIITGLGGQLDYLGREYPFLVDWRWISVQDRHGRPAYTSDQNWAEPSMDHASRLMRRVFENPETAREKARLQARLIRHAFSSQKTMAKLISVLKGLG